jgi:hypothetical protein
VTAGGRQGEVRARLEERYRRLAASRKLRLATATLARFREIDGSTQGILVSVQLFTTVIPLMILGFSYVENFAQGASAGTIWIRELGLVHPTSDRVRGAFGSTAGLRSSWTVIGVAGFLVWGIPLAVTVAEIFAKAWRREQFGLTQRVLRGALWFALYLTMIVCRERITFGHHHGSAMRVLLFMLAQGPVWLFWSLTPALLVRNGGRGLIHLAMAGLAGVVIDGVIIPLSNRVFFPLVLDGWVELGPIGIAMALFTWCGVIGVGWVVTACVGAVLWERSAPSDTVVEVQTDDLDGSYTPTESAA